MPCGAGRWSFVGSGERTLHARAAAHKLHSLYDSKELSQPARDASPGSTRYWERQVDPERLLDPVERARRAEHAKKSYFIGLARKSAAARRKAATP
jgi:hypothetical protein